MGDLNCKVGNVIKGNTIEVSKGGRILTKMCKRHDLSIINGEDLCEGTWTRIQKNKKSVLDYMITKEQDIGKVKKMRIDEDKIITPYRVNEEKETVYTDHCMMELTTQLMLKNPKELDKKYLSEKGYKKFAERIKEEKISEILNKNKFEKSYSQWSKKVIGIVEECSNKKKKNKGWKVNRKLEAAKKRVTRELKVHGIDKEEIRILKVEKNLIAEHIEREKQKKHHLNVTKQIEQIKTEGGVDSTAFWELKRRIEGRTSETAHSIENEEGQLVEEKEEILEVYEKYYQNLLETKAGKTEVEKETEKIVDITMKAIEIIALQEEPERIEEETVEKIVNGLKNKKSRDLSSWKNEYIKTGGDQMLKSIITIMDIVDETYITPSEWDQLKIKSIHKKSTKTKMKNKRGLFITNVISKVYERIIKERNQGRAKLSPNQAGGVKERSTIDHVMTVLAVIERNKYMNKPTFVTFADIEKCFDKIWLEDGLKDLWKSGMSARDCWALKKLNETAEAIIETPIGNTKKIVLKNTVKQGTVSGPRICAASMDTINSVGYKVITFYGPAVEINTLAYVDDLESAGSCVTANNTIRNCNIIEERKKIIVSTERGNLEY